MIELIMKTKALHLNNKDLFYENIFRILQPETAEWVNKTIEAYELQEKSEELERVQETMNNNPKLFSAEEKEDNYNEIKKIHLKILENGAVENSDYMRALAIKSNFDSTIYDLISHIKHDHKKLDMFPELIEAIKKTEKDIEEANEKEDRIIDERFLCRLRIVRGKY